jgi:hypothetical protein
MSAPGGPPPPATEPGTPITLTPEATAAANTATAGVVGVFGVIAMIGLFFLLFFHIGAGYLSYQKYASIPWAVVDFFFAYFYYPYYAFFLASDPSPQPMGMIGGMVKLFKGGKRRK